MSFPAFLVTMPGQALPLAGDGPRSTMFEEARLRELLHQPLTPTTLVVAVLVTAVILVVVPGIAAIVVWIGRPRPRRRGRRVRLRPPGVARSMSAALVGTAAVTTAAGLTDPATAAPQATAADAHDSAGAVSTSGEGTRPPAVTADASAVARGGDRGGVWRVRPGDTLSAIAQARLGDADRWPDIFALNKGSRFPGIGGRLTDPDLIYPGWMLTLPGDATGSDHQGRRPPHATQPSKPEPMGDKRTPAPTPTAEASPRTCPSPVPVSPSPPDRAGDHAALRGDGGVTLDTGGWLPVGVAAAVAGLAALVWVRRRHRYVPGPPSSVPLLDCDLTPLPASIAAIQRRLRAGRSHPWQLSAAAAPVDEDDASAVTKTSPRDELSSVDAVGGDVLAGLAAGDGVVALSGAGAAAAARGLLTAALTARPGHTARVVMPRPALLALFGEHDLPAGVPQLTVTADLDDALTVLETHVLRRRAHAITEAVDQFGADNCEAGEAWEPVVLVTVVPTNAEQARAAAVLAQGRPLGIAAILLGTAPGWPTTVVDHDGTTRNTTAGASDRGSRAGRFPVLSAAEARDILAVLAEARPDPVPSATRDGAAAPPPLAPSEPGPAGRADGPVTRSVADDATPRGVRVRVLGRPGVIGVDTSGSGRPRRSKGPCRGPPRR